MSITPAEPAYRRDLGNGLIQRWSTAADTEPVADLMGRVWRSSDDEPINPRVADMTRRMMNDKFPFMSSGDYAIVEDTKRPGRPIVACASLWCHQWAYEGVPFGVGQPENIASDPEYRGRGLIRALIDMVHSRSSKAGHLVQVINGIPYFYRQFGYEYALDFNGKRVSHLTLIPPKPDQAPEPYQLRAATIDDIPHIMSLYARRCSANMVWATISEHYWRYLIEQWDEITANGDDLRLVGAQSRIMMITDRGDAICGYAMVATKRWDCDLLVYTLELAPGVNPHVLAPSLLRALQTYGEQIPAIRSTTAAFREISFLLGRNHPLYEGLGRKLAPVSEPPYAWYVRVPDIPSFIRQIGPVLDRRLAHSALAGITGAWQITFYQGGLHMVFEQGHLAQAEQWHAPAYQAEPCAGIPPFAFTQLLFGYRNLGELRAIYPDIWFNDEGEALLTSLFPARPSWVLAL